VKDKRASWVLPVSLSVAMVMALAVRVGLVWARLPDTVASHFGSGGEPDAFMNKVGFFVVMALVGGGSVALVFASPLLLRITPRELISLPNRDYWLSSSERRSEATDRLAGVMAWIGAATTGLLVVATELTVQANLEQTNLDEATFLVFLVVYFAFVTVAVVRLFRMFRIPDLSVH
jgi:uncharacterized membrane protein